jgi:hypothetical protein
VVDHPGWHLGAGDTSGFTTAGPSTGARFEVRITVEHIAFDQSVLKRVDGALATGIDTIVREYRSNNLVRASIGYQNVDSNDPQAGFFRVHGASHDSQFDFTTYQFGGAIISYGAQGHFFELQLESDTQPAAQPELSVRHRTGGANLGARIQARNGGDTIGLGINFQTDADPHIWLEDHASTPLTLGYYHPKAAGAHVFKLAGAEKARVTANGLRSSVPTYADNAAALAGGLVANDFYKTAAGDLRIVV